MADKSTIQKARAIVTGASSGIGKAYGQRLARNGVDLLLIARRKDTIATLAEDLSNTYKIRAEHLTADLATEKGITAVQKAIDEGPPVSWLVCAAGFGTRGLFVNVDTQQVIRMTRLHVEANARLVRAALPEMLRNRNGRIVLLSSLSSFLTTAHYVNYSATKAYINMFARGLRAELVGTGVIVQALCPGLTKTEFFNTDEFKDFKYDGVPAWAWMSPEEVVDESMRAVKAKNPAPVFVPGLANKTFMAVMNSPGLGAAVRAGLDVLARKRKLY